MMSLEHDWVEFDVLPGVSRTFRSLIDKDEVAGERFPRHYWERKDLGAAVRPGTVHASAALWDRVARDNERLGAGGPALDLVEALRAGKGVVVATGQQPGLLGGPLYTLYKIASAVDLANWIRSEFSVPCAPLLWNAGDDVDFPEISKAVFVDPSLELEAVSLDPSAAVGGGWVGQISRDALGAAHVEARRILEDHSAGASVVETVDRAIGRARDAGEFFSSFYLDLFKDHGLLAVDARWPEMRVDSKDLFARYAVRAEEIDRDVSSAGEGLASRGYARQLSATASRFGLFVVDSGRRLDIRPEEREGEARRLIDECPEMLSPNVLLRPVVQSWLFPVACAVLGPGEVGYWAQLREVFERLEVPMPVVWPRLSATLVPGGVLDALGNPGPGPALRKLDRLIRAREWEEVPESVRTGIDGLRRDLAARLEDLKDPVKSLDQSLVQLVDSVGRKADFQLKRLGDQAVAKLRTRSSRSALLGRIRDVVFPKGRLQERGLSSLWPLAYRTDFLEDLLRLAALHRERLLEGSGSHLAVHLSNQD